MPLPAALRALQHRDFRVFWLGQLVSLSGNWMQSMAQAWLVLELTNSPFRLGLISTLQFGPFLVLSFVAGVIADRLPKRRLLLATQAILATLASILATLIGTGHVQYWHVALIAACSGITNTFDMPARQSFVVEMVGKADLVNAIALNSAAFNAARVFGPALAGFVIAHWGLGPAFTINAVSFLAVLAALRLVRTEGAPIARPRGSVLEEAAEAVQYALGTPRIRLVLSLLMTVSLLVFNWNTVVPLFARQVLGQGAGGLGVLMAILGAGALTGAVLLAVVGRDRPRATLLIGSAAVASAAALAMAFVRSVPVAGVVLFVLGASGIVFMASCNTTVQLGTPDRLRGRMMSLYTLVFVGMAPIGGFLVGSIAEGLGVPMAFLLGGSLALVVIACLAVWWWRTRPAPRASAI